MYQFASKSLPKLLLVLALPLAGCAGDNMFADESISPYGGSKQYPIKVANGTATVEECGDWSKNAADTETNEFSPNHGCAVQANIAAMAAYPNDLVNTRKPPKGLGWTHQSALINLTEAASSGGGSGGSGGSGGKPPAAP
jgi:Pilus biogenesis CpaD protein (pilus_cpaD)